MKDITIRLKNTPESYYEGVKNMLGTILDILIIVSLMGILAIYVIANKWFKK
jgi:hypothetical protein